MGTRKSPAAPANSAVALLIATRKGAFMLKSGPARKAWRTLGPMFFGHIVYHVVADPHPGAKKRTLLAAARTGHLGPTIFRLRDFGRTWTGRC